VFHVGEITQGSLEVVTLVLPSLNRKLYREENDVCVVVLPSFELFLVFVVFVMGLI